MLSSMEGLKGLGNDILEDVMSRLNGSDMASAACSFSDLRDISHDQNLWKRLCHSTWPSLASKEAHLLISSLSPTFFQKFYDQSYPLILYNQQQQPTNVIVPEVKTNFSPSDFVSLVDVYYKNKCILSKVIDGIPAAFDQKWFAEWPFTLDILSSNNSEAATGNEDEVVGDANKFFDDWEEQSGDIFKKLKDNIRLSWVLLHKKTGKAVNLTSWKALSCLPFNGDEYMLRFGCIVHVDDESIDLPQQLAECVISARCRLATTEDGSCCMRWNEISLSIEDLTGVCISRCKSLMVLNQALHRCLQRSNNHQLVEKGYSQYTRLKIEKNKRKHCKDTLAHALCISIEILVFAVVWYNCC